MIVWRYTVILVSLPLSSGFSLWFSGFLSSVIDSPHSDPTLQLLSFLFMRCIRKEWSQIRFVSFKRRVRIIYYGPQQSFIFILAFFSPSAFSQRRSHCHEGTHNFTFYLSISPLSFAFLFEYSIWTWLSKRMLIFCHLTFLLTFLTL